MKNSSILCGTGFDTPEDLFTVHAAAERGLHVDALSCALSRAESVTDLLAHALSDLEEGPTLNQKTLADAVWTLSGLIAQAKQIIKHAEEPLLSAVQLQAEIAQAKQIVKHAEEPLLSAVQLEAERRLSDLRAKLGALVAFGAAARNPAWATMTADELQAEIARITITEDGKS